MTRLRNWFAGTLNLLILVAVVGGTFVAAPALAGPGRGHGHHDDHRSRRDDSVRVILEQRARITQLLAERDSAFAQVDQLRYELAHRPTAADLTAAHRRIAALEQERGLSRRQIERQARHMAHLERQLAESRERVARLERRFGVYASHRGPYGDRGRHGRRAGLSD